MRKLKVVLMATLTLIVTSCGGGSSNSTPTSPTPPPTTETPDMKLDTAKWDESNWG